MDGVGVGILVGLVIAFGLYFRRETKATRAHLAEQDAKIAGVIEDLGSLRSMGIASGAIERAAKLPPAPPGSAAQLPADPAPANDQEPPNTKPSSSKTRRTDTRQFLSAMLDHVMAREAGVDDGVSSELSREYFVVLRAVLGRVQERMVWAHTLTSQLAKFVERDPAAPPESETPETLESETPEQIRARLEAEAKAREDACTREEEERQRARTRGEIGEVPRFAPDRPSEEQTHVFTQADADRLKGGAVPSAGAPRLPRAAADDWDDADGLTVVQPQPKPAGSTSTTARPPPHAPPRPATEAAPQSAARCPPPAPPPPPPKAPIPPLASLLSAARAPADERKTIEMPPPVMTPPPAALVDLGQTMASAGVPPSTKLPGDVALPFIRRIAAIGASGQNASHCAGSACSNNLEGVCRCPCARCLRRRRVLAQVVLEVRGPTPAQRTAAASLHAELVAEQHLKGNMIAHCRRSVCRGGAAAGERPSEVDPRLPEEHCECTCPGCVQMRKLLKRAVGQVVDAAVT